MNSTTQCERCGHTLAVHHATGCDGNAPAERSYWSGFESQPGYVETREAIEGLEVAEPRPCACRRDVFVPPA